MSNKKIDEESITETRMLMVNLFSGGMPEVPSVENQPEISLIRWQVMRVSDGDRLVGYHVEGFDGRVSTPVVRFDPKACVCMTSSGRRYQLTGVPGFDRDGSYVFNRAYSGEETKNVTDEYWSAIEKARGEIS